jgi:hypothetical protein
VDNLAGAASWILMHVNPQSVNPQSAIRTPQC